ncbi:kinase domain protein, partial (macronuclear) [Tetrahymena thermophila SB210]
MDTIRQNILGSQEAKYNLVLHLQKRKKVKEMYRMKGIDMLDKPELVISDIKEPNLTPQQVLIYQAMKSELTNKGYSDFRFLAHGAQGLVLLAKDSKTNMRYAIKGVQVRDFLGNLDEDLNNQVKQEVEILKKCRDSPYVVSLIDQFEGNEFSYLVLTECQGTLTQILEFQNKRLNELSAIKYAKDIAQGLYYIHSKGYLVNDLKTDSILIDYNGNAVVCGFDVADNFEKNSGYSINKYMGNFLYQAPECYDPADPYIGKVYHDKYQKLGITVRLEPSVRSEACSLGYLIYTLVQGVGYLVSNKHEQLNYDDEFKNFVYHKQLKYIIEGLTNFVPMNRISINEALIILKGIISFEFQLDEMLIETIDENTQQFTSSLKNQIEFVRNFSNKFYPIIKSEETLIQELIEGPNFTNISSIYSKQYVKKEAKIEESQKTNLQLQQRISEQDKTIKILLTQLEQSQNQLINQPQVTMMQTMKKINQQHFIFLRNQLKNRKRKMICQKKKLTLNSKNKQVYNRNQQKYYEKETCNQFLLKNYLRIKEISFIPQKNEQLEVNHFENHDHKFIFIFFQ